MSFQESPKIVGYIKEIKETEVFESGFKKRVLVVETDEQYKQVLPLEFTKDKTQLLDAFNIGDKVSVKININGREWTSPKTNEVMIFITLRAWSIDLLETAERLNAANNPPEDEPGEDLPF